MYANLRIKNGRTIKSRPEFRDLSSNILYWYFSQRILDGDIKLNQSEAKQALGLWFNLDLTPNGREVHNVHFKDNVWTTLKDIDNREIEVTDMDGKVIPTPDVFYLQGVVDESGYIPF